MDSSSSKLTAILAKVQRRKEHTATDAGDEVAPTRGTDDATLDVTGIAVSSSPKAPEEDDTAAATGDGAEGNDAHSLSLAITLLERVCMLLALVSDADVLAAARAAEPSARTPFQTAAIFFGDLTDFLEAGMARGRRHLRGTLRAGMTLPTIDDEFSPTFAEETFFDVVPNPAFDAEFFVDWVVRAADAAAFEAVPAELVTAAVSKDMASFLEACDAARTAGSIARGADVRAVFQDISSTDDQEWLFAKVKAVALLFLSYKIARGDASGGAGGSQTVGSSALGGIKAIVDDILADEGVAREAESGSVTPQLMFRMMQRVMGQQERFMQVLENMDPTARAELESIAAKSGGGAGGMPNIAAMLGVLDPSGQTLAALSGGGGVSLGGGSGGLDMMSSVLSSLVGGDAVAGAGAGVGGAGAAPGLSQMMGMMALISGGAVATSAVTPGEEEDAREDGRGGGGSGGRAGGGSGGEGGGMGGLITSVLGNLSTLYLGPTPSADAAPSIADVD